MSKTTDRAEMTEAELLEMADQITSLMASGLGPKTCPNCGQYHL